jgi:rhodanese-related sulfurtransferase
MKRTNFVRIFAVIAALSAYSAWSLTAKDARPFIPAGATTVPVPPGVRLIRLADAEKLWHDSGTVFVDVRSPTDYEFGHIEGALSLPESQFEERFPPLKERLQRARTIVVYCKSPDCGLSLWTAIRLHNEGLTQTVIFPEGWNAWFNGRLPITRLRSQ